MRYFIVFYFFNTTDGKNRGQGHMSLAASKYPSMYDIPKHIIEHSNEPITDITITNIIELSEQDYSDWVGN